MAVDIPPFDDPLVRQAFRLIPDRQALIDAALCSASAPSANDLPGKGLRYFADDLPAREQDLEQAQVAARSRPARRTSRSRSTPPRSCPGFVEAATLFAEQAKGAGVTVKIKKEDPNAYFDTSLLYTKLDFGQSFWTYSSLGALVRAGAPLGRDLERDPLARSGVRQAHPPGAGRRPTRRPRSSLWRQVQQIQYDEGGYIVWANLRSSTRPRTT